MAGGLAFFLCAIVVAVFVALRILGLDAAVASFVCVVTVIVMAIAFASALVRANRMLGPDGNGRLEVALRNRGQRRWRPGYAVIGPGHLFFHPYRYMNWTKRGKVEGLTVTRIGEDTGRRPSSAQRRAIRSFHVLDIDTDGGATEIALHRYAIPALRNGIEPTE